MIEFEWELQGVTPTVIDTTDILQFAGLLFNEALPTGSWNETTHVKSNVGVNLSAANTPNNNKFISQAGGTGGDSQADWGDGTEDLDQITDPEASLHINVTNDVAVAVSETKFFSYNGVSPAVPASGVDVKAAEVGDANFTDAMGSGNALALDDQASNLSHDYYIVISKSPTMAGLRSDKLRFEATIE